MVVWHIQNVNGCFITYSSPLKCVSIVLSHLQPATQSCAALFTAVNVHQSRICHHRRPCPVIVLVTACRYALQCTSQNLYADGKRNTKQPRILIALAACDLCVYMLHAANIILGYFTLQRPSIFYSVLVGRILA